MNFGTNTAIFDGYDLETIFSEIKSSGLSIIELAYNEGYAGDIDSSYFSQENANKIIELKAKYSISMHALGCTMNLAKNDAILEFTKRIKFANYLGITYLNACVGSKKDKEIIIKNLKALVSVAEQNACVICIENGGDTNFDFIADSNDFIDLKKQIPSSSLAINVDPGNMVSLIKDISPVEEFLRFLPYSKHCHIKNVIIKDGSYYFDDISKGVIDYSLIIKECLNKGMPFNLEIPLRMHRGRDSLPLRSENLAELVHCRKVLERSVSHVNQIVLNTNN